jgi:hypothetical protein
MADSELVIREWSKRKFDESTDDTFIKKLKNNGIFTVTDVLALNEDRMKSIFSFRPYHQIVFRKRSFRLSSSRSAREGNQMEWED